MPERGGSALSVIRGWLALAVVALTFLLLDLVQRIVISSWVKLRPQGAQNLLSCWQSKVADLCIGIVSVIGGARLRDLPRLPGDPGTLIVMNHQSLLDIPLVVKTMTTSYPRFVTRRRYAKGIPLVSHMLRMYEHPLVDPGNAANVQLDELAKLARDSATPLVIFPEGTRTRDGEVGRFRQAGLKAMLEARDWNVHLVVADGMWKCARIEDFVHTISSVEIRMAAQEPRRFETGTDTEAFIAELHESMKAELARLRETEAVVA